MRSSILIALMLVGVANAATINPEKLQGELLAAGVPSVGCNSSGTVWAPPGMVWSATTLAKIAAVISAHDPSPTLDQRLRAMGCSRLEWAAVVMASTSATKTEKAAAQQWIDSMYARLPK